MSGDWSVYAPRPCAVPLADHPLQRYFPVQGRNAFGFGVGSSDAALMLSARVMRMGSADVGELTIHCQIREMTGKFSASELRDIARQCLDCAHDLDGFPAAVLQRGGL